VTVLLSVPTKFSSVILDDGFLFHVVVLVCFVSGATSFDRVGAIVMVETSQKKEKLCINCTGVGLELCVSTICKLC